MSLTGSDSGVPEYPRLTPGMVCLAMRGKLEASKRSDGTCSGLVLGVVGPGSMRCCASNRSFGLYGGLVLGTVGPRVVHYIASQWRSAYVGPMCGARQGAHSAVAPGVPMDPAGLAPGTHSRPNLLRRENTTCTYLRMLRNRG